MSEYDAFAQDFSKSRQAGWPEFELLRPLVKKGNRVLDLGCGNGRLRTFLTDCGTKEGEYFGFDASEELLKIARENNPHDHFFHGNFGEKLPFGADQFDVVAAVASFHHLLSMQEQQLFFAEVFRVMKPNGKLFLTTWKLPRKYFWKNFWKKNWNIPFGKDKCPRTYRKTSRRELTRLAKKSGFTVKSCTLFREKNFVLIAEKKS
jgi:ubiquinone/menaquinone biosynthesis C-methylase UbiE